MTNVRPRKVAHKGRVEAAGFLFNTDIIGVAETRRRILDLWESGVQVFKDGSNHFVRLLSTVRVDCRHSVATPLVQIDSVLSAVPLSQDEFEMLPAPSHSVVFSKGGVACVTPLTPSNVESPENWLDVGAFTVVEVTSLGAAFSEPTLVADAQPFDARAKLDGVPAEASELRDLISAIKSAASGKGKQSDDWSAAQEVRGWVGGIIGSIASQIGRLLRGRDSASQEFTPPRGDGSDQGSPPKTNGWFTRLGLRLLQTSRLARVLGRRQAAYLGKMMDMFERGDLNEALKHAIPLGDLSSLSQPSPALGVPRVRNDLSIFPRQSPVSRGIYLETDVLAYLRQLYRSSFERLVAQNRIEEAAFVLAELLRANEEAVAFLERHGKLKLAAELAEARELQPGLVVRQWFIAGDIKRAVEIARRTQAFSDAVLRLERKDKVQAERLRVLWAASLAAGGNYASAVDVIWPLQAHRLTAREWMDKAIEVGGPVAGRMLARKLVIAPKDFADIRRRALTFLEDDGFEQQETRASFAEALSFGETTTEAQTLARVTARAVLRDAGKHTSSLTARRFRRLVNFSGDGPLRTDVPAFVGVESDQPVGSLYSEAWAPADCGSMSVHDAALLPNGRMLLALGEVGVRLLTRDGRTVTHFDQPGERLVISDNGNRAIALARRGEVWRLSRLDLIDWRSEDWCDARIDAFAPNYDGSLWFLGAKGDFYAIDAQSKSFDALWRVPDAGTNVVSVARSDTSCSFLTSNSDASEVEQWVYRLPLLTLRSRTSAHTPPDNVVRIYHCDALSAEGVYADHSLYGVVDPGQPQIVQALPSVSLRVFEDEQVKLDLVIGDESCRPLVPEILGKRVVSPVLAKDVISIRVIDLQSKEVTAELSLANAKQVSTRLTDKTLTVADNLGRVIVVDLHRNCSIRNFRI